MLSLVYESIANLSDEVLPMLNIDMRQAYVSGLEASYYRDEIVWDQDSLNFVSLPEEDKGFKSGRGFPTKHHATAQGKVILNDTEVSFKITCTSNSFSLEDHKKQEPADCCVEFYLPNGTNLLSKQSKNDTIFSMMESLKKQ